MNPLRTETGYKLNGMHVLAKPHSHLPTQQARTLLFVAQGLPQKRIADEMGVKVGTVKKACSDLSFKFNTHTIRETVHAAIKSGVLRYIACLVLICLVNLMNQDIERSYRNVRHNRTVRTTRLRRLQQLQNDLLAA